MRIECWIWEQNLRVVLEVLARIAAYDFDDDDWAAVQAGIASTDGENGAWYSYALMGTRSVQVAFAREVGTDVLLVRVHGASISPTDVAQVELLLSMASSHRLGRR